MKNINILFNTFTRAHVRARTHTHIHTNSYCLKISINVFRGIHFVIIFGNSGKVYETWFGSR